MVVGTAWYPYGVYSEAVNAFSATRPGSWLVAHVAARVDPTLFRWSRGRVTVTGVPPEKLEVTVTELQQAREIIDVVSVQNRYNLLDREHEPVLTACEAAGIAFLPWRPVASGESGATTEIAAVATEVDATPTQVALAWLLGHSPVILPIPGTARIDHLEENLAAAHLHLPQALRDRLDRLPEQA